MKSILIILMACLSVIKLNAQTSASSQTTKLNWVLMMDNPDVNYYEAVKAFDQYWANKEIPLEEDELFQADENQKQSKGFIREKRNEHEKVDQSLAFEYKRFKHWQLTVLPFVKEDGSIMNGAERIEQWKQQRSNRK